MSATVISVRKAQNGNVILSAFTEGSHTRWRHEYTDIPNAIERVVYEMSMMGLER